jgi:hypothetical protein
MRKLLLLALLGITGFAAPSSAETAVQIATRWGIVGIWQKDCHAPVGPDNDRQAFVVREGKLFLERSTGTSHDSNSIPAASVNARGELELLVIFTAFKQNRLNVHALSKDGRDRIVLNRNVDTDEYTVRNAILHSTGQPVPWDTRCD